MSVTGISIPLADTRGLPEVMHPKLRLFLSADLVGSTALKQVFDSDQIPDSSKSWRLWGSIISRFYDDVDLEFKEANDKLSVELQAATKLDAKQVNERYIGLPLNFWKTIGDEVIYWKDLGSDLEIWSTISVWIDAIDSVRRKVRARGLASGALLDIKSTAWIAGFPVRNVAIAASPGIPEGKEIIGENARDWTGEGQVDFIGPAIDIGFRVSQWSSASRFYISLDTAYLLSITQLDPIAREEYRRMLRSKAGQLIRARIEKIKINYGGSELLKGVFGGARYPRFWISAPFPGSLDELDEDWDRPVRKISWAELVESYCAQFYIEREKYISPPFIENLESITYKHKKVSYNSLYDLAVSEVRKLIEWERSRLDQL